MNNAQKSEPSLVDLFKLFFAIMVVAIHTHALADFNAEWFMGTYITNFAVPYFFVASGWFLGEKMTRVNTREEYKKAGRTYYKRLLKLYAIWSLVQFPLQIVVDKWQGTEKNIGDIILHRLHLWAVSSPGGGLWYVQATIILTIILCISNKRSYRWGVFTVTFVLFVFSMLLGKNDINSSVIQAIVEWYNRVFLTINNFALRGVYFVFGFCLSEYSERIKIINLRWKIICLIISEGLFIFFAAKQNQVALLLQLAVAMSLFIVTLSVKANYSLVVSKTFRKMSTIIYFTHIPVKYAVQFAFAFIGIRAETAVWAISVMLLILYSYFIITTKCGKKISRIMY